MNFYNKKEQLYLETDASIVELGNGLLQVGDEVQFPKDEAPDNSTLQPIGFASKSLTSAETCYSNIEREMFYAYYMSWRNSTTAASPVQLASLQISKD